MKITASISRIEFDEIAAVLAIEGAGSVSVKLEKVYSPEGWRVAASSAIRPDEGSDDEGAIVNAVAEAVKDLGARIVHRHPERAK